MSLSDLASLGSFVSGVAVLFTLVYLGLQMRQNAKHTRALIHQGRTERLVDFQFRSAEPTMAAAIIKESGDEPTPGNMARYQFERYCTAMFFSFEDSYIQWLDGLLSKDQYESFRRGLISIMSQESIRAFWRAARGNGHGSNFNDFVDGFIADNPIGRPSPVIVVRPDDVAREGNR